MLVGSARVNTQDQDLALQLNALTAAGCERVFTERASGAQRERPQLQAALDYMRAGDAVWGFSRFANGSTGDLIRHPMAGLQRNVEWFRPDGRANHDSNFSRALHGLVRRGLARPAVLFEGSRTKRWRITDAGLAEAARLRAADSRPGEKRDGDAGHRAA